MPQHPTDPPPPALIMLIKAKVHMVGKHLRSVKTHVLIVSSGLRALYGCVPRHVCVCVAMSLYSFSRLARDGRFTRPTDTQKGKTDTGRANIRADAR